MKIDSTTKLCKTRQKIPWSPRPLTIRCNLCKEAKRHSTTQATDACLEQYSKASSKLKKSLIVSRIINSVCQASPEDGFVKEGSRWFEVGDHIAREKIGQRYVNLWLAVFCRRKNYLPDTYIVIIRQLPRPLAFQGMCRSCSFGF
jgi:hypothetical protein